MNWISLSQSYIAGSSLLKNNRKGMKLRNNLCVSSKSKSVICTPGCTQGISLPLRRAIKLCFLIVYVFLNPRKHCCLLQNMWHSFPCPVAQCPHRTQEPVALSLLHQLPQRCQFWDAKTKNFLHDGLMIKILNHSSLNSDILGHCVQD